MSNLNYLRSPMLPPIVSKNSF